MIDTATHPPNHRSEDMDRTAIEKKDQEVVSEIRSIVKGKQNDAKGRETFRRRSKIGLLIFFTVLIVAGLFLFDRGPQVIDANDPTPTSENALATNTPVETQTPVATNDSTDRGDDAKNAVPPALSAAADSPPDAAADSQRLSESGTAVQAPPETEPESTVPPAQPQTTLETAAVESPAVDSPSAIPENALATNAPAETEKPVAAHDPTNGSDDAKNAEPPAMSAAADSSSDTATDSQPDSEIGATVQAPPAAEPETITQAAAMETQPAPRVMKISKILSCSSVRDRQYVSPKTTFSLQEERTPVVWMTVISDRLPYTLRHVYYHNDTKFAEVPLEIGHPRTRTWSNVTLEHAYLAGQWRVEVVTDGGEMLEQVEFSVVP